MSRSRNTRRNGAPGFCRFPASPRLAAGTAIFACPSARWNTMDDRRRCESGSAHTYAQPATHGRPLRSRLIDAARAAHTHRVNLLSFLRFAAYPLPFRPPEGSGPLPSLRATGINVINRRSIEISSPRVPFASPFRETKSRRVRSARVKKSRARWLAARYVLGIRVSTKMDRGREEETEGGHRRLGLIVNFLDSPFLEAGMQRRIRYSESKNQFFCPPRPEDQLLIEIRPRRMRNVLVAAASLRFPKIYPDLFFFSRQPNFIRVMATERSDVMAEERCSKRGEQRPRSFANGDRACDIFALFSNRVSTFALPLDFVALINADCTSTSYEIYYVNSAYKPKRA